MRLVDFLTEFREAVEDEKERQKNAPQNRPVTYRPTKLRPKRHR